MQFCLSRADGHNEKVCVCTYKCMCACVHACICAFVIFNVWVRKSECAMCEVLSLQSCVWGGGGNGGCIKCTPEVALAT